MGESSSTVLLRLGFARAPLGSPSGAQRSRRGAGGFLAAGAAPAKLGFLQTDRFPPQSHLQPFFRLSLLTMPRLCPISKEPCPGAADAADPPDRGRPHCSCSLMGSGLFGSLGFGAELALPSCHQGGPRVPPPSARLYYPRALYRTRLLRLSFCAGKWGWDGALSRS